MRRMYLGLLLLGCLSTISANDALVNERKGSKEEIDLLGDLAPFITRTLAKPIEAFITEQWIEVDFYCDFGTVTVSIYDETGGLVYQQSTSTYDGQQHFVAITSFDPGVYTIVLTNTGKLYVSGSFEIESD